MEKEKIENRIKNSLNSFFLLDDYLMNEDVHERSISHKLGCYLQRMFPEWNVDCEYNKDFIHEEDMNKRVPNYTNVCKKKSDQNSPLIFPDIIIHKRGKEENLVVIELKKRPDETGEKCDINKIKAIKKNLIIVMVFS